MPPCEHPPISADDGARGLRDATGDIGGADGGARAHRGRISADDGARGLRDATGGADGGAHARRGTTGDINAGTQ